MASRYTKDQQTSRRSANVSKHELDIDTHHHNCSMTFRETLKAKIEHQPNQNQAGQLSKGRSFEITIIAVR